MLYTIRTNEKYNPLDKIAAIKEFRLVTGCSLVEAKLAVEQAMFSNVPFDLPGQIMSSSDMHKLAEIGLTVKRANPHKNEHYVAATLSKLAKRVLDENENPVIAEKILHALNELVALGVLK